MGWIGIRTRNILYGWVQIFLRAWSISGTLIIETEAYISLVDGHDELHHPVPGVAELLVHIRVSQTKVPRIMKVHAMTNKFWIFASILLGRYSLTQYLIFILYVHFSELFLKERCRFRHDRYKRALQHSSGFELDTFANMWGGDGTVRARRPCYTAHPQPVFDYVLPEK